MRMGWLLLPYYMRYLYDILVIIRYTQWRIYKSAKGEDKPQEGAIIQPEGVLKRWNVLGKLYHFFRWRRPTLVLDGRRFMRWNSVIFMN